MDGNNNGLYPYNNQDAYSNPYGTPYQNNGMDAFSNVNSGYANPVVDSGYNAYNQAGYNSGFAADYGNDWNSRPVQASSKKGIPALVCGIVTLCLGWCWILPWLWEFPIATGIVAIVMGAIGRKRNSSDGKALAGLIMGAVGLGLPIIIVTIVIIAAAASY